jgi:hypothetical protein
LWRGRELGINTQFLREKFEVRRGEAGALRSGVQSLGDVLRIYTDEAVRLRGIERGNLFDASYVVVMRRIGAVC